VTIATAIAFILGWMLLAVAHATIVAATHLDARLSARSAADRLGERLQSDATGAWSVFVPSSDVTGSANGDGHELDFVSEDAAHRQYWWAYRFDASDGRVVKYTYASRGAATAQESYAGIASFRAGAHPLTDIAVPSSPAYDPLLAGTPGLVAVEVPFGWSAEAAGGNRLIRVAITADGVDRVMHLASGTAPSRFTVVVRYTPSP
jgi:hypothetical protein